MYFLGVDLGGTNIAVGLVDEKGAIVHKDSVPTLNKRGYEEIVKDMGNLCLKVIKDNNLEISDIKSIGIGSPGTCDTKNGMIIYANNLKFKDVPLREELQKYINLPVYIDNDANCAAYGESISGACKGSENSVTITLGTGVGGGIMVNGMILRGAHGAGGEAGHTVINMNGEQCTCGRKGCWEAYASATALIRDIKRAATENPDSLINEEVSGDIEKINAKTVFDAANKGDKVASKVIDKYLEYVAEGLVNIINIFDPEIIALGGGVAGQGEKIIAPIREKVKESCYGGVLKTKIVPALLGNDAGIIGAAMLVELDK